MRKIIMMLGCLFFVIGCSSKTQTDLSQTLAQDKEWKLTRLIYKGEEFDLQNIENPVTIGFKSAENRFFGVASCNNFFGSYQLSGNTLNTKEVGMTRKMCDPKSMEVENVISQLVSNEQINTAFDGKVLVLKVADIEGYFETM